MNVWLLLQLLLSKTDFIPIIILNAKTIIFL